MLHSIWDLSSLTRDRTLAPCTGRGPTGPSGKSWWQFLKQLLVLRRLKWPVSSQLSPLQQRKRGKKKGAREKEQEAWREGQERQEEDKPTPVGYERVVRWAAWRWQPRASGIDDSRWGQGSHRVCGWEEPGLCLLPPDVNSLRPGRLEAPPSGVCLPLCSGNLPQVCSSILHERLAERVPFQNPTSSYGSTCHLLNHWFQN